MTCASNGPALSVARWSANRGSRLVIVAGDHQRRDAMHTGTEIALEVVRAGLRPAQVRKRVGESKRGQDAERERRKRERLRARLDQRGAAGAVHDRELDPLLMRDVVRVLLLLHE